MRVPLQLRLKAGAQFMNIVQMERNGSPTVRIDQRSQRLPEGECGLVEIPGHALSKRRTPLQGLARTRADLVSMMV